MKLQKRLSAVGFDWEDPRPVLDKIAEELAELNAAFGTADGGIEEEFGDLLFSLVNLARHWGIDPEAALRGTNTKVERRFASIEDRLGPRPADSPRKPRSPKWTNSGRQSSWKRRRNHRDLSPAPDLPHLATLSQDAHRSKSALTRPRNPAVALRRKLPANVSAAAHSFPTKKVVY